MHQENLCTKNQLLQREKQLAAFRKGLGVLRLVQMNPELRALFVHSKLNMEGSELLSLLDTMFKFPQRTRCFSNI